MGVVGSQVDTTAKNSRANSAQKRDNRLPKSRHIGSKKDTTDSSVAGMDYQRILLKKAKKSVHNKTGESQRYSTMSKKRPPPFKEDSEHFRDTLPMPKDIQDRSNSNYSPM